MVASVETDEEAVSSAIYFLLIYFYMLEDHVFDITLY
jgi:hypothetical protein